MFKKIQAELAYGLELINHAKNLPPLMPSDRAIVDTLKTEGVCVTSLAALGLNSTSQLLYAAKTQLANMAASIPVDAVPYLPQIFTVTDLLEFSRWGVEERLLNIVENYIGLPIAFQGVHLRRDFANKKHTGTQLWHKDGEDRRIVKAIIYLNDVNQDTGPFEYIPRYITSYLSPSYLRIYHKGLKTGFSGISEADMHEIIPKSAWKSCPGPAGTIIFVDTRSVFHHGTLRNTERTALFFVYTAKKPKRPELCTQYNDQTFARPEVLLPR